MRMLSCTLQRVAAWPEASPIVNGHRKLHTRHRVPRREPVAGFGGPS